MERSQRRHNGSSPLALVLQLVLWSWALAGTIS